jgi:hypothetical protein
LIVGGAAIGVTGTAGAVIAGMAAIGGGIAAFMGGLVAADWIASLGGDNVGGSLKILLTNIGEAIGGFLGGIGKGTAEQMKGIDPKRLKALGEGIEGIGKGMVAAGEGMVSGVIGSLVSGIGSFFGAESPIDKIIALSKDKSIDAKRLADLGEGIGPLGEGMKSFSNFELKGGNWPLSDTDVEKFIKTIANIGNADIGYCFNKFFYISIGKRPIPSFQFKIRK